MVPTDFAVAAAALISAACLCLQGNAANARMTHSEISPKSNDSRQMVVIEGQRFFFGIFDNVIWSSAQSRCANLGMQLVTLDSQEKNDLLMNFIAGDPIFDYWYWSAAYKPALSPEWQWTTSGAPISFSDWGPGQPNGEPSLDSCMSFAAGVQFTAWRGWDDNDCQRYSWPYVCQDLPV